MHLIRLLGPSQHARGEQGGQDEQEQQQQQRQLARTEKKLYELLVRIYRSPEALLSVSSAAPLQDAAEEEGLRHPVAPQAP